MPTRAERSEAFNEDIDVSAFRFNLESSGFDAVPEEEGLSGDGALSDIERRKSSVAGVPTMEQSAYPNQLLKTEQNAGQ